MRHKQQGFVAATILIMFCILLIGCVKPQDAYQPPSLDYLQTSISGPDAYSTKEYFVPYPTPARKFFPSPTPWTGIWEDGTSLLTMNSLGNTNGWQGLVDGRYVFLAAVFPYSAPDQSGIYYYPKDTPDRMHYFPLEGKQGYLRILKVEDHLVTLRLEKDDSLVHFDLQAFQFTRDPNARLPTATPYIPKRETPVPTSIDWLRTAIPYP